MGRACIKILRLHRAHAEAMHSIETLNEVLALIEKDLNDCEISRQTGVPRATIRGWRHGKVPQSLRRARAGTSCSSCGHPAHEVSALPRSEYVYLLGLYLGDGCISAAPKGVFSLRVVLDRKYPGIVAECATAMAAVMPTSKVSVLSHPRDNIEQVGSYSRSWPCLFPQHGVGRKHDRPIRLHGWQQELVDEDPRPLIRGLIHSDGCYSINTIRHSKKTYVYPRYLFSNRSDDIRRIFSDACDQLGISWRPMGRWNVSVARRESIAMMDEFVGPKELAGLCRRWDSNPHGLSPTAF